jgi:phosphoserine aminotransferase
VSEPRDLPIRRPLNGHAPHRSHNFSAGPAAIPLPVLERVRAGLLDFEGSGASILEHSHRDAGGPVQTVMQRAERLLRALLDVPARYHVLFVQGGAHGQFAAVPLNLATEDDEAGYLLTGHWSARAHAEGRRFVDAEIVADAAHRDGRAIPAPHDWHVGRRSAYVHLCANETIGGLELLEDPVSPGPPLVADFTSTLLSRPVDVARYGVIYASSGKNLGPAGVTVVLVDDALLARGPRPRTPTILDWSQTARTTPIGSLVHTPPVFAIHVLALVLEELAARGGLPEAERRATQRARTIYERLDESCGFYTNAVTPAFRSRMNVPFRIRGGDPALEARFVAEATERGLHQLFGHPLYGGLRASLYLGVPDASVAALATFLDAFARAHT